METNLQFSIYFNNFINIEYYWKYGVSPFKEDNQKQEHQKQGGGVGVLKRENEESGANIEVIGENNTNFCARLVCHGPVEEVWNSNIWVKDTADEAIYLREVWQNCKQRALMLKDIIYHRRPRYPYQLSLRIESIDGHIKSEETEFYIGTLFVQEDATAALGMGSIGLEDESGLKTYPGSRGADDD
ncbi:hypothetical protein SADUNF_Sadunf17G0019600 [Salix dunnii]|uniref:Uncharacterized protein n=1 Tax=Salix dunnii TaxID=1413687 RepID=A0A835J660_9ROSI|nr:hypothetical protein SADUNF_Sadunf17G0019600 [Salix dunnii]